MDVISESFLKTQTEVRDTFCKEYHEDALTLLCRMDKTKDICTQKKLRDHQKLHLEDLGPSKRQQAWRTALLDLGVKLNRCARAEETRLVFSVLERQSDKYSTQIHPQTTMSQGDVSDRLQVFPALHAASELICLIKKWR